MTRRVSPTSQGRSRQASPVLAAMALALMATAPLLAQIDPQGDPELQAILDRESGAVAEPPPAVAGAEVTSLEGTVEATIDEIQELIALPATLGRESDEAPQPGVFEKDKTILMLDPPFVYVPAGLPDPLIIPWVRDQVVFQEKMDEARKMLAEGKASRQVATIKKAIELLGSVPPPPDQAASTALAALRSELAKEVAKLEAPTNVDTGPSEPTQVVVTLPEPVRATTNGIILDRDNPNESMVVVGDYMLRPGQTVPRFPRVRVKAINKQSVIYEFSGREFVVNVRSD